MLKPSIEDLIVEGESSELEFKSSFRWDYLEGKVNRDLEKVILKSIAAFSNAGGGILLIGVADEGDILGLEQDYASLRGNRDGFELHLRNLLNQNFGKVFATSCLSIDFAKSGEYEICKVEVKRGERPVFLEFTDKNGQKTKKFFVRSGNSSQELQIDEASAYIKSRFNNS